MKKLFVLVLTSLLVLTGCGSKDDSQVEPGATLKIGTAVKAEQSTSDAGETDGKFQADVTYATVVMEGEVIKNVQIDAAQNKAVVKADGTATFEAVGTKKERGADYGLNWFEQIADLENWLVGKTASQIKDASGDADLTSSVSISIDGILAVVEEAVVNAVEVTGVSKVGSVSEVMGTVEDGIEINTTVTAVAFDADGKVVYTFIDQSQLTATSENGKVLVKSDDTRTKGQLKEDYGMSTNGKVEWYKQVESFTAWTLGKTVSEVSDAENADITSSVSISMNGFISGVNKAESKAISL